MPDIDLQSALSRISALRTELDELSCALPASPGIPSLIGPNRLADVLDMTTTGIYRMHERGDLPPAYPLRDGHRGNLRWSLPDIVQWLESRREAA